MYSFWRIALSRPYLWFILLTTYCEEYNYYVYPSYLLDSLSNNSFRDNSPIKSKRCLYCDLTSCYFLPRSLWYVISRVSWIMLISSALSLPNFTFTIVIALIITLYIKQRHIFMLFHLIVQTPYKALCVLPLEYQDNSTCIYIFRLVNQPQ